MSSEPQNAEQMSAEPFVDIAAAAAFTGLKTSYLYEQVRLGKVPSYKVSKFRRFRISELEAWIKNGSHAGSKPDIGTASDALSAAIPPRAGAER